MQATAGLEVDPSISTYRACLVEEYSPPAPPAPPFTWLNLTNASAPPAPSPITDGTLPSWFTPTLPPPPSSPSIEGRIARRITGTLWAATGRPTS